MTNLYLREHTSVYKLDTVSVYFLHVNGGLVARESSTIFNDLEEKLCQCSPDRKKRRGGCKPTQDANEPLRPTRMLARAVC